MSVVSFILLISGLRKSRKMVKYNNHEGLNQRMKDFQVKLGMGLQMGWSIEGALGSYYKIDASYLSPHVKMAERLEGATKKFKVPLLISGTVHTHLTRKTRNYCRCVDWVIFPGTSKDPVKLFTVDVDTTDFPMEAELPYLTSKEKKIQRVQDRIKRNNLREAAFKCQFEMSAAFESDMDIVRLRKGFTQHFLKTYDKAFKLYVKGDWDKAKLEFENVLKIKEGDVVTQNLLAFMALTNYVPPENWKGYKDFDE